MTNGYVGIVAQINAALFPERTPTGHIEGAQVLAVTRGWTVARFEDDAHGMVRAQHSSWLSRFSEDEAWLPMPQEMFAGMLFTLRQRATTIRFTAPDDSILEINSEPMVAGMSAAVPFWLPLVTSAVWAGLEPTDQVRLHQLFTDYGVEPPR